MNIIALIDKLQLDRPTLAALSPEDVIRIEKRLALERRMDAEIDANTAADLVEALRNYREPLAALVGKRSFYNFFSGQNYSRNGFQYAVPEVPAAEVRDFIARFLEEEMLRIADRCLAENDYYSLASVCAYKEYLPENLAFRLQKKLTAKLEFAVAEVHNASLSEASDLLSNREFYELLSCFSDTVTDEKVRILINAVAQSHNNPASKNREFTREVMVAMSEYKPFDDQLADVIRRNKEVMTAASRTANSSSSSGSTPWWRWLLLGIIVIRAVFAVSRISSSSSSTPIDYQVDEQFQRQPIDYKTSVEDPTYFFNYLTNYDKKDLTVNYTTAEVKAGEMPFYGKYGVYSGGDGQPRVAFTNNSGLDLVVLTESAGVSTSSVFVPAGHSVPIAVTDKTIRFYFGKKLASFGPDNSTYQRANADNTRKIQEYRFADLPPNCRVMLDLAFVVSQDVTISNSKGQIALQSTGLRCVGQSEAKDGRFVFPQEKITEEIQAAP